MNAPETELPNTAIHLGDGPQGVAKANGAEADKFSGILRDDPRKVVVDPCGPIVCFLSAEYIRTEGKAVA